MTIRFTYNATIQRPNKEANRDSKSQSICHIRRSGSVVEARGSDEPVEGDGAVPDSVHWDGTRVPPPPP